MNDDLTRERLSRVARLLQADDRGSADLLPVQLQALQYLARCNRFSDTPASVADYLGVTKGTASQSLKVIEAAGFIAKEVDPSDRRVIHLHLTAQGRAVVDLAGSASLLDDAIASLDEDQRQALDGGLVALMAAMQQAGDGRSFGVCRSCRHFRRSVETGFRCGLLHEPLSAADAGLICREHEFAAPALDGGVTVVRS